LISLEQLASRPQEPFAHPPYDQWLTPDGKVSAEFFRTVDGFLVRFPAQVDFAIDPTGQRVICVPTPGMLKDPLNDIYLNSILPILGNYSGELNLHGSATAVANRALAFMGLSRRGKTTLVGACARAGYPFLTEDVLSLKCAGERYWVQPKRPVLRLFPDSAAFLLSGEGLEPVATEKTAIDASRILPHHFKNVRLARIYILGPGDTDSVVIKRLSKADALTQILQHGFILDVEDRARLRSHFERVARLVETVPCHSLDFPRNYVDLPSVIETIIDHNDEAVR